MRIRKKGDTYYRTAKGGKDEKGMRQENEVKIYKETFDQFCPLANAGSVCKTRYLIPIKILVFDDKEPLPLFAEADRKPIHLSQQ